MATEMLGRGGLLTLLLTAACLDNGIDSEAPPRAAFVDVYGARWELRRQVEHFAELPEDSSVHDVLQPRAAARWQDLSNEEAVRRLRPITLTPDNAEYALADDDALEFVEHLRTASAPRSADMSAHDFALSTHTQRVLSEERFPTETFGGDDRVNMNGSADQLPWMFIAAMADAGRCTAFKLLNQHTAITAAHCVHDGKDWYTRKTLQFAAGASEPRQKLDADCYAISVPGGWDGMDADYDYAVLRLREDSFGGGASCELSGYDVGYFGYQLVDECLSNVPLSLAGYPGTTDPDHDVPSGEWKYPTLFSDYRTDGWSGCAGVYTNALFFYNDGSNGQSGAPVWTFSDDSRQNYVRAIYRGSVTSPIGDSNRGRRLDDALVNWLSFNAGF